MLKQFIHRLRRKEKHVPVRHAQAVEVGVLPTLAEWLRMSEDEREQWQAAARGRYDRVMADFSVMLCNPKGLYLELMKSYGEADVDGHVRDELIDEALEVALGLRE